MIDNIVLEKEFQPPKKLRWDKGKPFIYFGITYYPKYTNGRIQRYEGQLKNLRLLMYPYVIRLFNSLHKFWHGHNHTDFTIQDYLKALQAVSKQTGINWKTALVKKVEFGCNIHVNAGQVIASLQTYKAKEYLPMVFAGKKYGVSCEFQHYRIKGYDKEYQAAKVDKVKLKLPTFRWEIQVKNIRFFERLKLPYPLIANNFTDKSLLEKMAAYAVNIYKNSIKMQQYNLSKLKAREK